MGKEVSDYFNDSDWITIHFDYIIMIMTIFIKHLSPKSSAELRKIHRMASFEASKLICKKQFTGSFLTMSDILQPH